jgi:hypothetical protein
MGVVLMLLPGVSLVRRGVMTVGQRPCPSVAACPRALAFLRPCPTCEPLPTWTPVPPTATPKPDVAAAAIAGCARLSSPLRGTLCP